MAELSYELIKTLAVYGAGRAPTLMPQTWVFPETGLNDRAIVPTFSGSGIDVSSERLALVGVRLNRSPGAFKGWLRINAPAAGVPYGVQYFGVGAGSIAIQGASAADIPTIVANVLADYVSNFSGLGSAALVSGSTDVIEWTILASNNGYVPPYDPPDLFIGAGTLIDEIISNGAGMAGTTYQSHITEATECHWRLWGVPNGASNFVLYDGITRTSLSPWGLEQVCCSGWDKLFVEVVSADGAVLPFVAPARLDTEETTYLYDSVVAQAAAEQQLLNFASANTGRLTPLTRFGATKPGMKAPEVKNSGVVTVNGATVVLPFNPGRTGFFIQNIDSGDLWFKWKPSRATTNINPAVGAGFQIKTELIRTGAEVVGNALIAIDDGGPFDLWVEEW